MDKTASAQVPLQVMLRSIRDRRIELANIRDAATAKIERLRVTEAITLEMMLERGLLHLPRPKRRRRS